MFFSLFKRIVYICFIRSPEIAGKVLISPLEKLKVFDGKINKPL